MGGSAYTWMYTSIAPQPKKHKAFSQIFVIFFKKAPQAAKNTAGWGNSPSCGVLYGTPGQILTGGLPLRRTTNSLSYDSLTLHPALFCVNLAQCVFGFSRCFASFCTVLRCWNTFRAISKKLADGIFELFKKTKLADY